MLWSSRRCSQRSHSSSRCSRRCSQRSHSSSRCSWRCSRSSWWCSRSSQRCSVVVGNVVEVVGDVVVGGVFEYHSCRPLNFLVTAKICKGLDEQTRSYKFSCNQLYSVHGLSMSPWVLNLPHLWHSALEVLWIPKFMKNLHIAGGSRDPQHPERFWC
jgi:hypothetical protein